MAQNDKPNVDDLFARMFGGTKPVENNPGGEDREENPPAKKTAAKPPAKAKKEVQPKPEKPAEPREAAEPPAQEPAPKAKRGRKPAAKRKSGILVAQRSTAMGGCMFPTGLIHGLLPRLTGGVPGNGSWGGLGRSPAWLNPHWLSI